MTADFTDPVYTGVLHTAGYPGDLEFGEYMYYVSDTGESADEFNHWYWMDTAGGQSGSPVWAEINGSGYILSIHAYEYIGGAYANFGTRLDQDKFDQLNTWLAADTPPVKDSNGWNPIITIIIVIGISIAVIAVVIVVRRTLKKPYSDLKPYHESVIYNEPKQENLTLKPISFCPICGQGVFRDTQRFCVNCGYSLLKTETED
jgi:ribosomal protein S27AE